MWPTMKSTPRLKGQASGISLAKKGFSAYTLLLLFHDCCASMSLKHINTNNTRVDSTIPGNLPLIIRRAFRSHAELDRSMR